MKEKWEEAGLEKLTQEEKKYKFSDTEEFLVNQEKLLNHYKEINNLDMIGCLEKYFEICRIEKIYQLEKNGEHRLFKRMGEREVSLEFYTNFKHSEVLENEKGWLEHIFDLFSDTELNTRRREIEFKWVFDKEGAKKEMIQLYDELTYERFSYRDRIEKEMEKFF